MLASIEVRFCGATIGVLTQHPKDGGIYFQYETGWQDEGVDLSPIHLPLNSLGVLKNDDPMLGGLHGLFWDSIPDAWGNRLLDAQLMNAGIVPERCSSLVRLAYIGNRAMGALEYVPNLGDPSVERAIELALLDRDAQRIMDTDDGYSPEEAGNYLALIEGGASAGGAKPKVCVGIDEAGSIHVNSEGCMEQWLVKLSAIPSTNKDSKQHGIMEHAYAVMASACGISTPKTKIIKGISEHGKDRWFFATKRFDRTDQGRRVHVHSLAGLLQEHHSSPLHSYEKLMGAAQRLVGTIAVKEEIFRRLVFNVLACNQDDHARNWAFLMDESGNWSLAPSYDLTMSQGPMRVGNHCLSVNGSRNPEGKDLAVFARKFRIPNASELFSQVRSGVSRWQEIASTAGFRDAKAAVVQQAIQVKLDNVVFPAESRKYGR